MQGDNAAAFSSAITTNPTPTYAGEVLLLSPHWLASIAKLGGKVAVGYVDSATIGCLMDLYRQASAAGGSLKLAGVQKRVETMLTMTGAHNFLEVHADQASALASFGG